MSCQVCYKELKEKRELRWKHKCQGCKELQEFVDTSLCSDCYLANKEYYNSTGRRKQFIDEFCVLCEEKGRVEEIIKENELVKYLIEELIKTNERVSQLEEKIGQLQEQVCQLEEQETGSEEKEVIHNILLIGRTGNGKSTLANVLTGTNQFKEGKYAVSETREIQNAEFEYEGIKYRVIDTVGIGDTKISEQEVLDKMAEATYSIRNGLHQVLFVTSGRFGDAEVAAYNLLRNVIFDKNIAKYTTIVRTRFPEFEDQHECSNDLILMIDNGGGLTEAIKSCNKVIHVENHPVYKETRNKSRTIFLNHLATCQYIYKPRSLKELNTKIDEPMSEKERIQKKIRILSEEKGADCDEVEQLTRKIKKLENTIRKGTTQHIKEKRVNWKKKAVETVVSKTAEKVAEQVAEQVVQEICLVM